MRYVMLWICMACMFTQAWAQGVGINNQGNPPDPSAALDLDFSDKGLLIPRVQLISVQNASPVVNPANGLLVYNLNPALPAGEGFYFWSGAAWTPMVAQAGVWSVQGNQVFYTGGNVGIGTANPQGVLDIQSTNSGVILPRLTTTQRNGISQPVPGMMIYNLTTGCFESFTGSTGGWKVTVCDCNPSGGFIVSSANPSCAGDSVQLSAQNFSGTIEWQVSTDSINFQSLGLFTPSIQILPAAGQTRFYRVKASSQTCSDAFSPVFKQNTGLVLNTQFSANPSIGVIGQPISFTPQFTLASTFSWQFQGATPAQSSIQTPAVTWNSTGSFSVQLAVTDANGCTDTARQSFSVVAIPTNAMELWLRADSGVVHNAGVVSQWNDWSGNNRHAVQATENLKPIWVPNMVNGRPVLRFNGANELVIPSFNVGSQSTMFFVINLPTASLTGQMGVISDQTDFATRFHFYLRNESGAQYAVANGGVGFRGGSLIAGPQLISYVHTGTTHAIFRNSVSLLSGSNSSTYTSSNPILLGRAPGISAPGTYTGDLLEIIIYNRQLNATEITQVETYLRNKYAFP